MNCCRRSEAVLSSLHPGSPCYECGQRFHIESLEHSSGWSGGPIGEGAGAGAGAGAYGTANELAKYRAHLDGHFQQRRRELLAGGKGFAFASGRHRKWFLLLDDWVKSAVPDSLEDLSTEENAESLGAGASGELSSVPTTKKPLESASITAAVPGALGNRGAADQKNAFESILQNPLPPGYKLVPRPQASNSAHEVYI